MYRIGFGEAVERDLLTDYKVLILTLNDKDVPPAVQRMISDGEFEINTDDASDYSPKDYRVNEVDEEFKEVVTSFEGSSAYPKLTKLLRSELDQGSYNLLRSNPDQVTKLVEYINDGTYDKVMTEVNRKRVFGEHSNIPDLEAFRLVANEMVENGTLQVKGSTAPKSTPQKKPKPNIEQHKARKKVASKAKGNAPVAPNFSETDAFQMSSEEFDKLMSDLNIN